MSTLRRTSIRRVRHRNADDLCSHHGAPGEPVVTRIGKWFRSLGPGLIAGAADDDPAGIATYSVVGAQFGNAFLWSAFVTWPLMACAQMTCARVGLVSGSGLGGAIRKKLPRWVGGVLALALLGANAINIAADLAGMGEAMSMLHLGPALARYSLRASATTTSRRVSGSRSTQLSTAMTRSSSCPPEAENH